MECEIMVCKHNKNGKCTKYKNVNELFRDFEKGGGCPLFWFIADKLPKHVKKQ